MRIATSSRRIRRQPTEDIEEAVSSQAHADEEVEEEQEEAPPRPAKGAKKEKKRTLPTEEVEEADPQEEDDPLADFVDQPVDRQQSTRIAGLAKDWAQARTGIHVPAYLPVKDIASYVAEFADGEKGEKNLADVDKMMRSLVDTENELRMHEQTLDDLYQQVTRGEPVPEVILRYEEGVQKKKLDYQAKTSRQKYAKHEEYSNFRQAIYEVQHPEEAMPPVMDLIPPEDGDDSDDDDDIQVGGVTQDYKCPLTLTMLVDPLTSNVCGHSFAADAIREYLHDKPRQTCPNAGCNQMITLGDLKPNKALAKKAREADRRQRMREEEDESDDDNVIE
ncbi:hypothetical protein PHLGIDRAFT_127242 [Phlebiopsis gigantea 11061_1 CR5-6]|uniref:SP-RING-type domain-containing protein n=1 Tax=Phlebiopsis gigantea (strain 11061_1 CR5-6) TaxID=745531 RepID=A0A0C3PMY9_PHLG1|nr:hypothetical protein PHLGIDRAFT_127242 [Phlebiopsis gigantea 11061_1 CR5-6]